MDRSSRASLESRWPSPRGNHCVVSGPWEWLTVVSCLIGQNSVETLLQQNRGMEKGVGRHGRFGW